MQNTPYMMFLVGHFNAKCTNWYKHDKTNFEGIAIENISLQSGLYQVMNEPTHNLKNSSSVNYIKRTSKTQYVKMSKAFRKIYSHHQALYKINSVTEITNVTKLRIEN